MANNKLGFTVLNWKPSVIEQELLNGTYKDLLSEECEYVPEDMLEFQNLDDAIEDIKKGII